MIPAALRPDRSWAAFGEASGRAKVGSVAVTSDDEIETDGDGEEEVCETAEGREGRQREIGRERGGCFTAFQEETAESKRPTG